MEVEFEIEGKYLLVCISLAALAIVGGFVSASGSGIYEPRSGDNPGNYPYHQISDINFEGCLIIGGESDTLTQGQEGEGGGIDVDCPEGTYIIYGGCDGTQGEDPVQLFQSAPIPEDNAWSCKAYMPFDTLISQGYVEGYAVCCPLSEPPDYFDMMEECEGDYCMSAEHYDCVEPGTIWGHDDYPSYLCHDGETKECTSQDHEGNTYQGYECVCEPREDYNICHWE